MTRQHPPDRPPSPRPPPDPPKPTELQKNPNPSSSSTAAQGTSGLPSDSASLESDPDDPDPDAEARDPPLLLASFNSRQSNLSFPNMSTGFFSDVEISVEEIVLAGFEIFSCKPRRILSSSITLCSGSALLPSSCYERLFLSLSSDLERTVLLSVSLWVSYVISAWNQRLLSFDVKVEEFEEVKLGDVKLKEDVKLEEDVKFEEVKLGDMKLEEDVKLEEVKLGDLKFEEDVKLGDMKLEEDGKLGDMKLEEDVKIGDMKLGDMKLEGDVKPRDMKLGDIVKREEEKLGDVKFKDVKSEGLVAWRRCQMDASWCKNEEKDGLGWVFLIPTSEGRTSHSSVSLRVKSPLVAEGMTLRVAMDHARILGISNICFESDSQSLINIIARGSFSFGLYGIISDIAALSISFISVMYKFISRDLNTLVDRVEEQALAV